MISFYIYNPSDCVSYIGSVSICAQTFVIPLTIYYKLKHIQTEILFQHHFFTPKYLDHCIISIAYFYTSFQNRLNDNSFIAQLSSCYQNSLVSEVSAWVFSRRQHVIVFKQKSLQQWSVLIVYNSDNVETITWYLYIR